MGKLHIGTADNLNRIHDPVCLFLQLLLHVFRNGQHGGGTEGITGMYAYRINILDEADRDHIAFGITHHLQLQLFPSQNGLLHQHLSHQAGLQASGTDGL